MDTKIINPALNLDDYEPKFTGFYDLMAFRVREILLVSSPYDAFVLEEDGRLSERVFEEYVDLKLQFAPRITHVSTAGEALAALNRHNYDLVIAMTRIADMDVLDFGRKVKAAFPRKPIVLLTFESLSTQSLVRIREGKCIDKVFCWSGNTRILLAIVKYVEDLFNAPADTRQGVQVILVVEDSAWYYSIFLPIIYAEIVRQTHYLITHAVNDFHRLLRMRARPKILMAENYEQALEIYGRYRRNILALVSDVRFPRGGSVDPAAGLALVEKMKAEIPDLPVLLQSREAHNQQVAYEKGVSFLNKNSPNLLQELQHFILANCGFGEFVFRLPDGRVIGKAANLTEFEAMLKTIPEESLLYHAGRNHFSIWLRARTEFELAEEIRPRQASDFRNVGELRAFIIGCIERLFGRIQSGVIADYGTARLDLKSSFIKLGSGSIGGKGRGIAFINSILARNDLQAKYPGVEIRTPRTFIVSSDIYEEFLEKSALLAFALAADDDETIARRFLAARLPERVENDLRELLTKIHYPLAVRSSSILEDSQMLPFAGVYSTYMVPNNHPDLDVRHRQLLDAVKLVFASVFYQSPKEYVRNADMRVEDEKMAVLIQEVVGETHGDLHYPVLSGVAQSYNFYPIWHMEPANGMACLGLGLGKMIVDGENAYRFSPAYPKLNPPYSSPAEFVKRSQSRFYALDLGKAGMAIERDEGCTYRQCDLSQAESDGVLAFVASTYSKEDGIIRDTIAIPGPRIVNFAPILKFDALPLANILEDFFSIGFHAYGAHVEIEFAVNMFKDPKRRPEFDFLQIRPMVAGKETLEVEVGEDVARERCVCMSPNAMGNGVYRDLRDLVYVDPDRFDPGQSRTIAGEIGELNRKLGEERCHSILIGFGRFGTADPWLGIPVEWSQMSQAVIVIESNLGSFMVDPSQGSHFFHNLISLRMGYLHVRGRGEGDFLDWAWLKAQPVLRQTEHVRHVRFARPLQVRIDGRSSRGAVLKPE